MHTQLLTGSEAPDFNVPTTSGQKSLTEYTGKFLVIFFYPRDDTSGCTTENKDFTLYLPEFTTLNTELLGVSKDPINKHQKFMAKHDLAVTLASDNDTNMCEDYGVWKEKSMYGKTYMGIERTTFLIDPQGKIAQIWSKVRVKGHAQAVLEAVKAAQ